MKAANFCWKNLKIIVIYSLIFHQFISRTNAYKALNVKSNPDTMIVKDKSTRWFTMGFWEYPIQFDFDDNVIVIADWKKVYHSLILQANMVSSPLENLNYEFLTWFENRNITTELEQFMVWEPVRYIYLEEMPTIKEIPKYLNEPTPLSFLNGLLVEDTDLMMLKMYEYLQKISVAYEWMVWVQYDYKWPFEALFKSQMGFDWALEYPEIYKICTLFGLDELRNPKRFAYKKLLQYLQEGPQCGLVALAMALGNPTKEKLNDLLSKGKECNFTYNGEIFSASDMTNLARIVLPTTCSIDEFSGDLNCERVKEFLFSGGLILAPYDTDKDNSPGLHNGHKAHWAIISGAVETAEGECFVLARHGKTKNVAIWNLNHLAQSNKQLHEFSPDRKYSDLKYKLPEGGIDGIHGINSKAVLIKDTTI